MFSRFIILVVACISLATCVLHEITLYSEPSFEGDEIIFRSKHPLFHSQDESFVQSAKSWCATGLWSGYTSVNFTGSADFSTGFRATRYCSNGTLSTVRSLRHYGPSDTTILSISLYKGMPGNYLGGEEVIVTEKSRSGFGFGPAGAVLTGPSNWTLFPNPNFGGVGICLVGRDELQWFTLFSISPASVKRDCDPQEVSSYITE